MAQRATAFEPEYYRGASPSSYPQPLSAQVGKSNSLPNKVKYARMTSGAIIITSAAGKITATEASAMPTVDVATIGKIASGAVFFVCASSFLIGIVSGFHAIFPPMALLVCGMSAIMYGLSLRLRKQWTK